MGDNNSGHNDYGGFATAPAVAAAWLALECWLVAQVGGYSAIYLANTGIKTSRSLYLRYALLAFL